MIILPNDELYSLPVDAGNKSPKSDQFIVLEDITVTLLGNYVITIPKGFITDFHSTPKWLHSVLPGYHNRTNIGALVHDYLYVEWEDVLVQQPKLNEVKDYKKYADLVYFTIMEQFYEKFWRNKLYYLVVLWFGGYNWYRERCKKQNKNYSFIDYVFNN